MTFRNLILPTLAFTIGIYILATQLVIPLWQFRADESLFNPVAGVYTTFWEQKQNFLMLEEPEVKPPPFFYLSAPKIKLENTPVETNSTKAPDQSLVHIKGTALPGDGPYSAHNLKIPIVISGHSVSPIFFNSNDPKTYFTNLPKLEDNNIIELQYRKNKYKYRVVHKEVVKPGKLWEVIKNQAARKQSELVLFTCVPPGIRLNRLIIFATSLGKVLN